MTSITAQQYALGYSEDESKRLELQHDTFADAFGGALAPRVKEFAKQGKITTVLELATGTGIWARDALKEFKQLGQDVTIVATDLAEYKTWPKVSSDSHGVITFQSQIDCLDNDLLAELKQKYTGGKGFSLIHFRLVGIFVPSEKWTTLTEAIISLLAPGGIVQHEGYDALHNAETVQPPLRTFYKEYIEPMMIGLDRRPNASRELVDWFTERGMNPVDSHIVVAYGRCSARKVGVPVEVGEKVTALQKRVIDILTTQWAQHGAPRQGLTPEEAQKKVEEFRDGLDPDKHEFDDRQFYRQVTAVKTALAEDIF